VSVRLYAVTCGHLTRPTGFLLAGRDGRTTVPVPAYVIVHPKGTAVFDTGLHVDAQDDPVAYAGELLTSFHEFDVGPGAELAARLGAVDVDAGAVTHVINSHLHFDHAGGNAQLPNATVVVQGREWDAAERGGAKRGYLSGDYDTGQPVQRVDGEHDVFGDGSVVCFPTYGHTPGHQSLRVRTESGGEVVLCGDACYLRESLEADHLPGVLFDADGARASFQRFRDLQAAGARIMYGHDPDFWATVPQAPVRLG
jgi:glyoxylase-like metal-dependent hydrolase (beta-lactamase superfamily II)